MIDKEEAKKAEVNPINKEAEITDVDLGFVDRRKFRFNGDFNRILELNVSDMNIYSRYTQAYPKLQKFAKEASERVQKIDVDADDAMQEIAKFLTDIDTQMREQIDYIFDTNASEICAPEGNMFDPVNGSYRFEHIIDTLAKLYTTGFESEIAKFKNKTSKHTSKYTKKYHN